MKNILWYETLQSYLDRCKTEEKTEDDEDRGKNENDQSTMNAADADADTNNETREEEEKKFSFLLELKDLHVYTEVVNEDGSRVGVSLSSLFRKVYRERRLAESNDCVNARELFLSVEQQYPDVWKPIFRFLHVRFRYLDCEVSIPFSVKDTQSTDLFPLQVFPKQLLAPAEVFHCTWTNDGLLHREITDIGSYAWNDFTLADGGVFRASRWTWLFEKLRAQSFHYLCTDIIVLVKYEDEAACDERVKTSRKPPNVKRMAYFDYEGANGLHGKQFQYYPLSKTFLQ